MTEERVRRQLRQADVPEPPDPAFVDRLFATLVAELDSGGGRSDGGNRESSKTARARAHRRSWPLLAAAALLVTLTAGALLAGAALLQRNEPVDDLLARLRAAGEVSIAVSREHPQAFVPGGEVSGFDVEVADVMTARLELIPNISPVMPESLVDPSAFWEIAMSSSALTPTQEDGLWLVEPVYFWPLFTVVLADSPLTDPASLAGRRVGVSAGSEAAARLPDGAVAVATASDLECIDLLAAGGVDACQTSELGPADLAARPQLRTVDDLTRTEPRGPVLRRNGPDPERFVGELRRVIGELRADGTLPELSRRWLGADLTLPDSEP